MKHSQKGFIGILVVILLLLGLGASLFLITKTTIFKSRASEGPGIVNRLLTTLTGQSNPASSKVEFVNDEGTVLTSSRSIYAKVRLTYVSSGPTFYPASGRANDLVNIYVTGAQTDFDIYFNNVKAEISSYLNPNTQQMDIQAIVPQGATTGKVKVVSNDNNITFESASNFTITNQTASSASPPTSFRQMLPKKYAIADDEAGLQRSENISTFRFSDWQPVAPNVIKREIEWNFPVGNGQKNVYAKFQEGANWLNPLSYPLQYQEDASVKNPNYNPEVKVWVISYQPVDNSREYTPDPISFTKNTLLPAINEGSKYHGYSNQSAPSSILYTLANEDIHVENNPPPIKHYPRNPTLTDQLDFFDYAGMFQKYDLCNYAKSHNIRMVVIWAAGEGLYGGHLLESLATGNKGIPANTGTLPTTGGLDNPCTDKTIALIGLNYTRGIAEALESYGHQLESVFGKFRPEYENFSDRDSCGGDHNPPNSRFGYDRSNTASFQSDCRNFKADGTSVKEDLTCNAWGCSADGWLKFWMQNMPGYNSGLLDSTGRKIPNWWVLVADPDNCLLRPLECSDLPRPATITQTINLSTGWNLIGLDLLASTLISAEGMATDLKNRTRGDVSIQGFDASHGQARAYFTDPARQELNSLTSLQPGASYWIRVSANTEYVIQGMQPTLPAEVAYQASWQMVSFPYLVDRSARNLAEKLKEFTGADVVIQGFDPAAGQAKAYYTDSSRQILNSLTTIERGTGYWLRLAQPTTVRFNASGNLEKIN